MTKKDADTVAAQLEQYRKDGAHILIPTIKVDELVPIYEIVLATEYLSPHPRDGEVYVEKKGYQDRPDKLAIRAKGYGKLALCASVEWDADKTKITFRSLDGGYIAHAAHGIAMRADGSPLKFSAEGDSDMGVERDIIESTWESKREEYLSSGKDGEDWFKKKDPDAQNAYILKGITKEINFKNKSKMKLAATSARTRALKAFFMANPTYTAEELKKPFIIPRVVFRLDYSDPAVARMVKEAKTKAVLNVYGDHPSQVGAPAPHVGAESQSVGGPEKEEPGADPREEDTNEPSGEELLEIKKLEFKDSSKDQQIKILEVMIAEKMYVKPDKFKGFEDAHRMGFYDHLMKMESDIPF